MTVLGEPAGSRPLRTRVGYVTQSPSVYGDLTVRENVTHFARLVTEALRDAGATVRLAPRQGCAPCAR